MEGTRIPLNEMEEESVNRLLRKHGPQGSLTRTEPGETGPVRVEIGKDSWLVDDGGHATKERS